MITGPLSHDSYSYDSCNITNEILTVLHISTFEEDTIEDNFKKLWSLESIGMNSNFSENEDKAVQCFRAGLQYKNGKYTSKLPWKDNHPKLPNNYDIAQRMLHTTWTRLRKNPHKLKQYHKVFIKQLN